MAEDNLKTIEQVRAEFGHNGISFLSWANEHHLPYDAVHAVMSGTRKGRIGIGHDVAVLLGIKAGKLNYPDGYTNKKNMPIKKGSK
jgi:gp16 family phage-associated protein